MPVTAKLSRIFYERMGDQVATELVEWFNAVDLTYRQDLQAINELNFARFDANVGQRFAEFEVRWEKRFADLEVRIERRFAEQTRSLFLAWTTLGVGIVGLWFRT